MASYKQYARTDVDRIVFLSDIHLGVKSASIEWIENIRNYFNEFFIPLIRKYKSQDEKVILVIAGDFFDNRQHIDINILNTGVDIMMDLASEVEVFLTVGNHDIYKKKDTDVSSLRVFKQFKNVHVIDTLSELLLKNCKKMLLVPWMGSHTEETELLTKFSKEDFIVMHTDIAGLKFDNGREIIDGTNINVLEHGKIYSGHIHKRQECDKVVYLGSPYQMRRSDIGNIKGVYSIRFSGNDSTKQNEDDVTQEFVTNTYSPKFLKLRLMDMLNLPMSEIKKLTENNYVDILVKKQHMNELNMAKLMEAMDICNTKKIEVILDKNDENELRDDAVEASKDLTISEIFDSYLGKFDLTAEDIKILQQMNATYLTMAVDALGGEFEIR